MPRKPKPFIVSPVELPNGDMVVDIPKPILKKLGWIEGTALDLQIKDGAIVVTKADL